MDIKNNDGILKPNVSGLVWRLVALANEHDSDITGCIKWS